MNQNRRVIVGTLGYCPCCWIPASWVAEQVDNIRHHYDIDTVGVDLSSGDLVFYRFEIDNEELVESADYHGFYEEKEEESNVQES